MEFLCQRYGWKKMTRGVDSIGANIAKGAGSSYQDNKRFVKMARGSLNETQYWVKRAYTRQLINID
jgi:four helix bundle protein